MIRRPPRSTLFPYTTLFRSPSFMKKPRRESVPSVDGAITGLVVIFISPGAVHDSKRNRSEEHTSELQSHLNLVCRLLLEKKNRQPNAERRPSLHYSLICCTL